MIKSYWLRILLCGVGAAVLGFVIALLTPKQYDGFFQVMVAPYAPSVRGASGDEASESVEDLLSASAPRTVNTQVEVMTSFQVFKEAAESVANQFGLPQEQGGEFDPFELQDRVSITAAKESDIVTLRVRMSDPKYAEAMAKQIYLAFEAANERQSRAGATQAITFLEGQVDTVKDQLASLDTEGAKLKQDLGTSDIQVQTQAETTALKQFEGELVAAQAAESDANAQVAKLREELNSGTVAPFVSGGQSSQLDQRRIALQQRLSQAEAELAQVKVKYEDDSEPVQIATAGIKRLQSELKKYDKDYAIAATSTMPNPVYQELSRGLMSASAAASGAHQKVVTLQSKFLQKQADVARLPDIQRKLQNLARRQNVLERINAIYQSKLSSLKLAGQGRRSNTVLVSSAVAIPKPTVPNMNLNIGLGLFLGLAAGFLWAVGTEAKRNPIRSLGQLNRLALQPCYRVVPELRVPMRGLSRPTAEVFEALLVNFIRSEKKGYRLGVLGVTKNAGATTSAMNLAIAAARGGYSVLYVEVDPGNNALTKLTPAAGDVKSPGSNITIYNASLGETTANGTMGLPTDLEDAAKGKDIVIFDFAPVKSSGDAFLIANQLDEMVLLVRANQTKSIDFLQAQQALIDAGCPMVSVTLSRVQDQSDDITALEQYPDVRAITPQT